MFLRRVYCSGKNRSFYERFVTIVVHPLDGSPLDRCTDIFLRDLSGIVHACLKNIVADLFVYTYIIRIWVSM